MAASHKVIAVDIDLERVEKVNNRISPIEDLEIEKTFANEDLDLVATADASQALKGADFAIIATPTDYDADRDFFNTDSVEQVLAIVNRISPKTVAVIKSTIPIGFTARMQERFPDLTVVFSPEFLREGKALEDNRNPSRIIAASRDEESASLFARILLGCSVDKNVPVLVTNSTEAEAIKLFSNTFLAMRVAFFNELDTYSRINSLNTRQIIDGVSLDPRIGQHYNNPSFGYGGYCLPKDTRQLLSNYKGVPQTLISATVESNIKRKQFIADEILKYAPSTVGIYRLTMKAGSDNFRSSSIQDVMHSLTHHGVELRIFEPSIDEQFFDGHLVCKNLEDFIDQCDLIVANRKSPELLECSDKLFTTDDYSKDTDSTKCRGINTGGVTFSEK